MEIFVRVMPVIQVLGILVQQYVKRGNDPGQNAVHWANRIGLTIGGTHAVWVNVDSTDVKNPGFSTSCEK